MKRLTSWTFVFLTLQAALLCVALLLNTDALLQAVLGFYRPICERLIDTLPAEMAALGGTLLGFAVFVGTMFACALGLALAMLSLRWLFRGRPAYGYRETPSYYARCERV